MTRGSPKTFSATLLGAFLLASACLTLAAGRQRPAPAAVAHFAGGGNAAEVPMELSANGVFVPAQVDGGRPSNWLVDTASPATIADPSVFTSPAGPGNAEGRAIVLGLPGLQWTRPNLPVHSFEALGPWYGLRVSGVIGDDLLSGLVAELDYSRLSIELYPAKAYRRPRHMKKIPVRWIEGLPTIRARLRLGKRTVEGNFALNTGAVSGLVVFHSFLAAQQIPPPEGKTIPGVVIDKSGAQPATLMRGQWIDVGPIRVARPVVSLVRRVRRKRPASNQEFDPFQGAPVAGWIGGGILRKFRLVLDFSQNCIFAAPNRDFVFPIEADASGATITAAGENLDQFEVRSVRAGSPAARAGLEPGDRILVIDGEAASDLSLDQIRDLLTEAGHTPVMGVERLGKKVRIELQLKQTLGSGVGGPATGSKQSSPKR